MHAYPFPPKTRRRSQGLLGDNKSKIKNCAKFLYFTPRTPLEEAGELTADLQASGVPKTNYYLVPQDQDKFLAMPMQKRIFILVLL